MLVKLIVQLVIALDMSFDYVLTTVSTTGIGPRFRIQVNICGQ